MPDDEPSAAGVDPAAQNNGEFTVLRDGWSLIKKYFFDEDEVRAITVSDYLDTVTDPFSKAELQKGFSDAMGCEDEHREIVGAMIEAKLKQFGKFFSSHFHSISMY
jgi:hypothetical protein